MSVGSSPESRNAIVPSHKKQPKPLGYRSSYQSFKLPPDTTQMRKLEQMWTKIRHPGSFGSTRKRWSLVLILLHDPKRDEEGYEKLRQQLESYFAWQEDLSMVSFSIDSRTAGKKGTPMHILISTGLLRTVSQYIEKAEYLIFTCSELTWPILETSLFDSNDLTNKISPVTLKIIVPPEEPAAIESSGERMPYLPARVSRERSFHMTNEGALEASFLIRPPNRHDTFGFIVNTVVGAVGSEPPMRNVVNINQSRSNKTVQRRLRSVWYHILKISGAPIDSSSSSSVQIGSVAQCSNPRIDIPNVQPDETLNAATNSSHPVSMEQQVPEQVSQEHVGNLQEGNQWAGRAIETPTPSEELSADAELEYFKAIAYYRFGASENVREAGEIFTKLRDDARGLGCDENGYLSRFILPRWIALCKQWDGSYSKSAQELEALIALMESAQGTENNYRLHQDYLSTKDELALLKSVLGDDLQALSISQTNRREWWALQLQVVVRPLDGKIPDWILSQESDTDRVVHDAYKAWKLHEQRLTKLVDDKDPPDNGRQSSGEKLLQELHGVLQQVKARDSGIGLQSTGGTTLAMELSIEGLTSASLPETQQTLKLARDIQERNVENGFALAEILLNCGKIGEAASLINQVLPESANLWGTEDLFTLRTMALQARVNLFLGNHLDAEAECKNALEQMRLALGPYNFHTLEIASTLTDIYIFQGRWSNAETIALHVFEKERVVLGPRNYRTLKAMDNLAEAKRLVGKLQEARDLAEAAMRLSLENFEHDHPATLLRMSRLCLILCDCNEWDYATSQATETLEKLSLLETPGTEVKPSNLSAGLMRTVIGSCLRQLSTRKQLQLLQAESVWFAKRSREILHDAFEVNRQTFDNNHLRTHEAQLESALTNRETSCPEEIWENALPEIHTIYSAFAQEIHVKTSPKLHEVHSTHTPEIHVMVSPKDQKTHSTLAQSFNSRHPFLLTLQLELSQTYCTLGALDLAKGLAEKALKSWTEQFGRFHPRAIQCVRLLATIESSLPGNQHGKAQAILEELLKDGLEAFPAGYHFLAFDVQADLAKALVRQGSHSEAIELQEEVVAKRKEYPVNKRMSRETIRCMHDLAMMYQQNQNFEKATKLHNEVQAQLLADDLLCLASRANLAVIYFAQRKFGEAADLEQDIWERQRELQGPNHRDTLVCQFNLACTLMKLERPKDEVTDHLEEVVRKFDEIGEHDSIEAKQAAEALKVWREKP